MGASHRLGSLRFRFEGIRARVAALRRVTATRSTARIGLHQAWRRRIISRHRCSSSIIEHFEERALLKPLQAQHLPPLSPNAQQAQPTRKKKAQEQPVESFLCLAVPQRLSGTTTSEHPATCANVATPNAIDTEPWDSGPPPPPNQTPTILCADLQMLPEARSAGCGLSVYAMAASATTPALALTHCRAPAISLA